MLDPTSTNIKIRFFFFLPNNTLQKKKNTETLTLKHPAAQKYSGPLLHFLFDAKGARRWVLIVFNPGLKRVAYLFWFWFDSVNCSLFLPFDHHKKVPCEILVQFTLVILLNTFMILGGVCV